MGSGPDQERPPWAPRGGEGVWGPGRSPTPPHQKTVLWQKMKFGRKFEADFRYTNFFWPLTLPQQSPARKGPGGGGPGGALRLKAGFRGGDGSGWGAEAWQCSV